ncbi:MAG: hypothetical protein EA412_01085 [Chitinophagaceae bacterium]|nr:MAG: hypothetical protein EA412_01085 [Chitinophagaceae bacterium]
MKYFDYILFLSFHEYKRGNKETFGAFTISALWLAFLQPLWLFILLSPFEFIMNQQLMIGVQTPIGFALYIILFAGFNIIYLNTNNRKQNSWSLKGFNMSAIPPAIIGAVFSYSVYQFEVNRQMHIRMKQHDADVLRYRNYHLNNE